MLTHISTGPGKVGQQQAGAMPSGHRLQARPASAQTFQAQERLPRCPGCWLTGSVWEPDRSPCLRGQGMGTEPRASYHPGAGSSNATRPSESGPFTSFLLVERCHPD